MRIFELSPRLRTVAGFVSQGASFADVGTDHAYLPVWLILQGVISRALVSDLRSGPLDRARQTASYYGVSDKLTFRLCDGLSGISAEEADTIVIAGMGGETIAEILSAALWAGRGEHRFLLQPMTAHPELRAWLTSHGFTIEQEALTQEGETLYITIVVKAGDMEPLTPAELWAGRQYKGMVAPHREAYLNKLLYRAGKALTGIRRSTKPEDAARATELELVTVGLKEMQKEWILWQQ